MTQTTSSFDQATIIKSLEALANSPNTSEQYIRFRIELLKAQHIALTSLQGREGGAEPTGCSLSPSDVPFDHGLLTDLLSDLCGSLQSRDHCSDDLIRLSDAAADDPAVLEELARSAAFGPDETGLTALRERLGMSVDGLLFFGRVLAAPCVTDVVRRARQAGAEAPQEPVAMCPWCGSPAGLAMLDQDGKRILCCGLCGEQWGYHRMNCPFCEGSKDLGRLTVDDSDPRWVEVCDHCLRYIKTVDVRKLPEGEQLIPLVEAIAMTHMDLIAEEQGCIRALPYTALL
ncbi:MAG: formate dehydrogenase accessory protein FdhE [Phycisphaerales bacterium]|nr:formate dehydrogenase accessory protein FdhE [Phycisphaerales bacterium]